MPTRTVITDVNDIPIGIPGSSGPFAPASVDGYAAEALVTSTRSTHYAPLSGRKCYAQLTGTGSAPITLVYSFDGGTTYSPMTTGTGSETAPITVDAYTYNGATQNGMLIEFECDVTDYRVAILPGTVSGTVTLDFFQKVA